jgi:hypothetical protein
MSALSPLPNAAFAIPDFDECARGGKLIQRGIQYLPLTPSNELVASKVNDTGREGEEGSR